MRVMVDAQASEERSRLVLVLFTSLSMRLMENWRELIYTVSGKMPDYERTMILGAIITISAEKLTRIELIPELQTLEQPFPSERLTECNIRSVAAAVGLDKEAVRRKVSKLIDDKLVDKDEKGLLQIGAGLLQLPVVREVLRAQLELLRRTVNQLSDLDVLLAQTAETR